MGLLSSSVSITRYRVDGEIEGAISEVVADCLSRNAISEIEDEGAEKIVGWTSFENPFNPNFEGSSFVYGNYFVFSLRIDKKTIPPKLIRKHCAIEMARRLAETEREHLSKNEKKAVKDHVVNMLSHRIPATPSMYDALWSYEESVLWFFSTQKAANEELETLFGRSFKLTLVRLFPYTIANFTAGLTDPEIDILNKLVPTRFTE